MRSIAGYRQRLPRFGLLSVAAAEERGCDRLRSSRPIDVTVLRSNLQVRSRREVRPRIGYQEQSLRLFPIAIFARYPAHQQLRRRQRIQ
ncbi:hypothetical protein D3C80_1221860 [compost metagenome]